MMVENESWVWHCPHCDRRYYRGANLPMLDGKALCPVCKTPMDQEVEKHV